MTAKTIADAEWESYRHGRYFIQRYVFPGGQLPSSALLDRLAGDAGLATHNVMEFGLDYARTLAAWHTRFDAAWPRLAGGELDEHFRRLWKLYLTYCEAGFRLGRINVRQLALRPAGL